MFDPAWRVAAGGTPPADGAGLILIDAAHRGMIAAIRGRGDALSRAAIVGIGLADAAADDTIPTPVSRDALSALARRWSPIPTSALDRLSASFGHAQVVRLAAGLTGQLCAAIPPLTAGGAIPGAHQLAGLAGMLGFVDLGRQWAALDEGEAVDRPALRIDTRRAIVALDRFVAAAPAQD